MKIEYLPHTADIKMRIEDPTIEGLFLIGVKGMNDILKKGFCDQIHRNDIRRTIEINAPDYTSLLIDFLSDVLSLSYTEKAIYSKIQFQHFSENKIIADIFGAAVDHLDEEIKAVTYHEAAVKKNARGQWETNIIFDI